MKRGLLDMRLYLREADGSHGRPDKRGDHKSHEVLRQGKAGKTAQSP